MRRREDRRRPREEKPPFDAGSWTPRTELGRKVKAKEIASIEQIFETGKPILEHEIVEVLLPNLKDEVLRIQITQRMTDCGRKGVYRATVMVGDGEGHIGIGVGKADEVKPAIESAIKYAKRNVTKIPLGCGSWECGCNKKHTVPIKVFGKNGSVQVTIKPGPRGLGIAAGETVKKVLRMAGIKDAWCFARGRTNNVYNIAMATLNALDSLNAMKFKGDWESRFEAVEKPVVEKAVVNEAEKGGKNE